LRRIWTSRLFASIKLKDGERFAKALGGVDGRRLTYAELTGKTAGGAISTVLGLRDGMEERDANAKLGAVEPFDGVELDASCG
jgi:hypothetical protein